MSLHELDTTIRIVNATSSCPGVEIPTHRDEVNDSELQIPVIGSRLVHVAKSNVHTERLISSSCLLLVSTGGSCKNCAYAYKLYCNRASKRKRAEKNDVNSSKRNERYLNRSGLENKVVLYKRKCNGKLAVLLRR